MFITIKLIKIKTWIFRIFAVIAAAVLFFSVISYRYPLKYLDIINKNSVSYNIEPALVCAVIHAESKFVEEALSHKGASGLMQITEGTADWVAEQMNMPNYSYDRIFEPSINITIGCDYLAWLLERYRNVNLAVAAYNAGCGNVDKWLKNPKYSADGKNLDVIPFKETQDYVNRVLMNKWVYDLILHTRKQLYGEK